MVVPSRNGKVDLRLTTEMTSTARIVVGSTNTTRFSATVYLTPFASGAVASALSGKKKSSVTGGTCAPTAAGTFPGALTFP